jgi:hypothetical protein
MVMIMIAIMVMIVTVPPVPITLLVCFGEMAIVPVWIAVDLDYPLIVITSFTVIPAVTIVIIRVSGGVVMVLAPGGCKRQHQRGPQKKRSCIAEFTLMKVLSPA